MASDANGVTLAQVAEMTLKKERMMGEVVKRAKATILIQSLPVLAKKTPNALACS